MCDLHSRGSAGSGCHPDKFAGYVDQNPLPAIPANARVRPFGASGLNFTGLNVTTLGPGITIQAGGSNSHRTVAMSSTPADPFAAYTGGHQATKTKKTTITKIASGKRRIPLSTKNVYSSTATSGRGRAKVGGGGV